MVFQSLAFDDKPLILLVYIPDLLVSVTRVYAFPCDLLCSYVYILYHIQIVAVRRLIDNYRKLKMIMDKMSDMNIRMLTKG